MSRLKIAVQKSGRLNEGSIALLKKCGLKLSKSKDALFCRAQKFPVDILFVRDDDIPNFVSDGICDLGIVGENVLEEIRLGHDLDIKTTMPLGFARCKLSLAITNDSGIKEVADFDGLKIATSYPEILKAFFKKQNVSAKVLEMKGSVEVAPRMKMADAIFDLVSTGATLENNGLKEFKTVLQSEAVLIQAPDLEDEKQEILDRLIGRMKGVINAEESKYIMLHAPKDKVDIIADILPGAESPTVLNLEGQGGKVAIHAVCQESVFWETMENLKANGASAILVLPIEKMLD